MGLSRREDQRVFFLFPQIARSGVAWGRDELARVLDGWLREKAIFSGSAAIGRRRGGDTDDKGGSGGFVRGRYRESGNHFR